MSETLVTGIGARQLVVFSFAGEHYALPINAVSEIIRYTPPRTVASDQPGVEGVIGLRGKIIPVVDLAATMLFGAASEAPGKIVIVETGTGHIGVIVDEVDEVRTVTDDQLEHVPTTGGTIAKLDERLVVLLDPAQLITAAE
jgi:purine-binding chemotaxis protein CheW